MLSAHISLASHTFSEHLTWISRILNDTLNKTLSSLTIDCRVHVTGNQQPELESSGSLPSPSFEKGSKVELESLPNFQVEYGRPSITSLLREEVAGSLGSVSVDGSFFLALKFPCAEVGIVAGPSPLAQSVRAALRSDFAGPLAVLRGGPSVSLHVETFGTVKG